MKKFHFGDNLKRLRQLKGYTQFSVSFDLGISQATYSRIETQPVLEDVRLLVRLAKMFGVKPGELMQNDPDIDNPDVYFSQETTSLAQVGGGSKSHLTNILVIIAGVYFTSLAYDFTKSFCGGLGLSINTSTLIGFSVALLTTFSLWYWVTWGRRKGIAMKDGIARVSL